VAKKIRPTDNSRKAAAPKGRKASPAAKAPARAAAPRHVAQRVEEAPRPLSLKGIKSPLSKPELKEFRDVLLAKRRALLGDMSNIANEALHTNRQEGAGDLSNMPTHPADIGTDNYEQEFTLGLLESERVLLREINEALDRIENNIYGVCLGTGEPIAKARLKARPWAKYGIEYAKMLEKGLVRPPEAARSFNEEEEEGEHEHDHDDHEGEHSEPTEGGEIEVADAGEDDEE